MSNEYPGYVLEIERTFHAPAQAVFDAWTSEEVLKRWCYGEPRWTHRTGSPLPGPGTTRTPSGS